MKWTVLTVCVALSGCGVARDVAVGAGKVVAGAGRAVLGTASGGLCGVRGLEGERIDAVDGPGACGIPNAVRITSVAGVRLSQSVRARCSVGKALDKWVRGSVKPAYPDVVELRVAAGYACRTRNSRPGARLSEHAKGKAIDISGFKMVDGSVVTLLGNYPTRALRRVERGACGPFGTVLGPKADVHHRDHFHFDTADYRSGPYCR